MIVRIVRMEFRPDETTAFEALFNERQSRIRAFDGCQHVVLWRDAQNPAVYYTYSHWESLQHLDRYRFSAFFKETWGLTKALFAAKAQAFSAEPV